MCSAVARRLPPHRPQCQLRVANGTLFRFSAVRGRKLRTERLSTFARRRKRLPVSKASFSGAPQSLETETPTEDAEKCTERLLEWDELCVHVSRFASTAAGKGACRDLRRGRDCAEALMLQQETKAIEAFVAQLKVEFDFGALSTDLVSTALNRCRRGGVLMGTHLKGISALLTVAYNMRKAMMHPLRKGESFRELRQTAAVIIRPWSEMEMDLELGEMIEFAVDEHGSLKDSASEELMRARVEMKRVRKKLEKALQAFDGKIVERSGRLCVAVSSGGAVPAEALVLDAGSSGTVYYEPRSALALNNDLSVTYAEMKNAEESILWNLTSQVVDRLEHLTELFQMVVSLDVALARYRYTQWIDGAFPQFSFMDDVAEGVHVEEASLFLSLINLRHPLLLGQSLIYDEADRCGTYRDSLRMAPPIPNDVILPEHTKALVITGPNAGGKTATLKALGLCALMAKAGLGLPAKQPVWIPFYSSVLADIGDEQSLTSSLSTFSGHLHRIQNLRAVADGKCLVLLDELGTGTDPKEGAALGAALLKALVRGGAGGALTTVVSTHHGLLKNLAYEHQIEREDGTTYSVFENASMEFDDEELAPTYRLIMGVPGQSNALNIASRLGMDMRIVGAAEMRLGKQHVSENILISRIQAEQEQLEEISDSIGKTEKKMNDAKRLIREIEQRKATLDYQVATQEADEYIHAYERGKAELQLLKHHKHEQQREDVVLADPLAMERQDVDPSVKMEEVKKQGSDIHAKNADWVPRIGEEVYVPFLGKQATLIQLTSNNKAVIRSGFLTITVESTTLQPL